MNFEPRQLRPAAFLDRDGTMVVEKEYLADPDRIEVIPHATDAVRLLNQRGCWVIGVTNQSGVARGYFGEDVVRLMNARVIDLYAQAGARIDRIYYCPHYPTSGVPPCACRKPQRGMIDQAIRDLPIDLSRSVVIGDRADDIQLAHTIGAPGILVLTGYGREESQALDHMTRPAHVAADLYDAVRWWDKALSEV
jgi:D-glycero-D-manno-heptose 1,7-bisphosphate phosphatase